MKKRGVLGISAGIILSCAVFGGYEAYAEYNAKKNYQTAQTAINKLFRDKKHRILADHVNEKILISDQVFINKIKDSRKKALLENEWNKALSILKAEILAEKKVSSLMEKRILRDSVTQKQIEEAQKLVTALTDKKLQDALQKTLDEANRQIKAQDDAKNAVTSLFSDGTFKQLAANVNRETFNKTKLLVDAIQNVNLKSELSSLLDKGNILLAKAEAELAAKAKEKDAAAAGVQTSQSVNAASTTASVSIHASSPSETGFAKIVASSKTAQRTDQIITVVASGATASVTLWEKSNNLWREIFSTSGYVGSQGVGQASEGSKHTPKGSYTLGFAFGHSNPGTILPFRQITSNSYWISDVNSNLYNTWQEGNFAGNGNEHLADYENLQYYYAIVINYNTSAVKGAGSAFFLHVSNGRPTAGCVSVPKSYMEQLMKRIHPGAQIINVTSQNEVANY